MHMTLKGGDLRRLCRTAQAGRLARAILEKRVDGDEVLSCALPSLAAVQWNDLRKVNDFIGLLLFSDTGYTYCGINAPV